MDQKNQFMENEIVSAIAGAIVSIAAMIFRQKQKTKTTRRKTKTVQTGPLEGQTTIKVEEFDVKQPIRHTFTDPETLENTVSKH